MLLVDDGVGEVRAGPRRDGEAGHGGERGKERGRDEVDDDVRAARLEPESARVLVVHRADLDGVHGAGKGAAAGGREQEVAVLEARDLVGAEAVERAVGRGRRLGLVGAQDGELEVGEERGVRAGEADDDGVVAFGVRLGDGGDLGRVPRADARRAEGAQRGDDVVGAEGRAGVEAKAVAEVHLE
ncbi:MAG TPA: hypothetical protein VIY73_08510, partial [Polyangiaceae bacterium]